MVEQHDGTTSALSKLAADYDVNDRLGAMNFLQHHAAMGQVVTGLLYVEPDAEDLHEHLNTVAAPLNTLSEKELCPGSQRSTKSTPDCGSTCRGMTWSSDRCPAQIIILRVILSENRFPLFGITHYSSGASTIGS